MADEDEGLEELEALAPPGDPPEDDLAVDDNPDDFEEDAEEERTGVEEPDDLVADTTRQPSRQEPPQPSRGQRRVQSLNHQLREANRRIDDLIQAQRAPTLPSPQQPTESPQQREARRAQMSPEERLRDEIVERDERIQRAFNQQAFQQGDMSDRALYEAKAIADPLYRRWQSKVEEIRAKLWKDQGRLIERETILYHELGKAMVQQRLSGKPSKQQQQAARRVKANTTRAGAGARSDTAAARRQTGRSLEERLADQPL